MFNNNSYEPNQMRLVMIKLYSKDTCGEQVKTVYDIQKPLHIIAPQGQWDTKYVAYFYDGYNSLETEVSSEFAKAFIKHLIQREADMQKQQINLLP